MSTDAERLAASRTPTTEAGRALLHAVIDPRLDEPILRSVDAIEAEARAEGYAAGLAAAPNAERIARLVVSYADLTHEVVAQGRGWREISEEWTGVVEECRAYLNALRPPEWDGDDIEAREPGNFV